jgi:hypothetical protein
MTTPNNQQRSVAKWSLSAVGGFLLIIAIFTDPVGSSPDSGIIDLGPTGTSWLLGSVGALMVAAGAWTALRERFFD